MQCHVDLGPRAQRDHLAVEIRRRVLANLEQSGVVQSFSRMWGTVVVVRKIPPHESAWANGLRLRELTLRFDYGRLVVHAGRVGRPDVTLWGSDEDFLQFGGRLSYSNNLITSTYIGTILDVVGAASTALLGDRRRGGGVEVFGRVSHPRFVYRLARLLRRPVDAPSRARSTCREKTAREGNLGSQ